MAASAQWWRRLDRTRRALVTTAAMGVLLFAAIAWDVQAGGMLATRIDPTANDVALDLARKGPSADVGGWLSLLGSGPFDATIVAVAALALLAMRRWSWAVVAVTVPLAASWTTDAMKVLFARGFPPGEVGFATAAGEAAAHVRNPEPFTGPAFAFPSSHTMGAVVAVGLAVLLVLEAWMQRRGTPAPTAWRWRRRAILACILAAVATGIGRVLLTVHWTTDVLASWALGSAIVATTLAATGWGQPQVRAYQGPRSGESVRVIGFTGMPGAGKSEAMEVARQLGIPVVRMGDLIWEEVERQGKPRDAKHVGEVANAMRQSHGKDVWALRTVARVREVAAGKPLILIDGVRSHDEVETLRRELGGDFLLVAIHTDRHHRFERMLARGRADDPLQETVLQERDEREMGWGLARTIALADEMVVNDGTLDQFREKVRTLLRRHLRA